MAILTIIAKPLLISFLLPLLYLFLRVVYRTSPFHPLAHIPGPFLPRVSSLWLTYHAWIGNECTTVHALHQTYGPVVRTGPYSVDIADGEALHDIYSKGGGFRKAAFYGNFDIDGHKSLFSEIVSENRALRAKAVVPLFSTGCLRQGREVLEGVVASFVERLEEERGWSERMGRVVNLLELTRGLALDAVTEYLFGRAYGALEASGHGERAEMMKECAGHEMSANGMVDLFVGVGRFWYLPAWAFQWVDWLDARFGVGSSKDVAQSLDIVDKFVVGIVDDAMKALEHEKVSTGEGIVNGVAATSYPARLLAAGLSISETRAQCKDLIFAGADSTGMNMATILFYLARDSHHLKKLQNEMEENKNVTDLMEIQSLPYLRGVVREGLRLSMANPSRLPRVVPSGGWNFKGTHFPADTEVSCTPFELHLNPAIFPEPNAFSPERWAGDASTLKDMERDAIPFGLGPRQCIARNLATAELFLAVKAVAESRVLEGAKPMSDKIEILEWFNSHVVDGKIELQWV